MTRYDSVLQRVPRSAAIQAAMRDLLGHAALLCSSAVSVLEAGFSARSAPAHAHIVSRLTGSFEVLPPTPDVGLLAIELQAARWPAGRGRTVGVVDLLQAATAVAYGATVLHYDSDSDFDQLARVDTRPRSQWVVPRGTVD